MLRRIRWILVSMVTRPLVIGLGGFALVLAIVTVALPTMRLTQLAFPQIPRPKLIVDSVEALEQVRQQGRQAEVDAINLNYLWADMENTRQGIQITPGRVPQERREFRVPGDEFFQIVEEFPNLEIVYLTLYGSYAGTEQVARVPKLRYLSVDGVVFGETADVGWLARAKQLQYLEIAFFRPIVGWDALGALPRLETLVFRTSLAAGEQVLQQVSGLPRLQTLVLAFNPSAAAGPQLDEQSFVRLAQAKSLRTLYVGSWVPHERAALLAAAQRGAPQLEVLPALVLQNSPFAWFMVYPAGILAVLIGACLAIWFRSPFSRLAPRFVAAHAAVALVLASVVVAAMAWKLWATYGDPAAALVATLAGVGVGCSIASGGMAEIQAVQRAGWHRRLFWLKQLFVWALLVLCLVPNLATAVLRGEMPWVLAGLGVMAVASLVITVATLRGLVQLPDFEQAAVTSGKSTRLFWQMQFREGWLFSTAAFERRIDNWAKSPPGPWWQRVERWRAGNPPIRGLVSLALMLAMAVPLGWLSMRLFSGGREIGFGALRGQVLLLVAIGLLAMGMRAGTAWRMRMLVLPVEELRPGNRRAMRQEMAAGLLVDLAPSVAVVAAFLAAGVNLDPGWQVAWARVPGDFVLFAICVLPIAVALAATMAVVQREWLAAVIALAVPVVVAAAIGLLVVVRYGDPSRIVNPVNPRLFLTQIWAPGLVGVLIACLMYRRWMRLEAGSRA